MAAWLVLLLRLAVAMLRRRRDLVLENLALRHQLLVLHRTTRPPRLSGPDRALWVWLARRWQGWTTCLRIVRPDTVILQDYFAYYHRSRTHLGLDKHAPEPRPVQGPNVGRIMALPQVGGLHRRYERRAA